VGHEIIAIPALRDNYIWCVADTERKQCVVIDPGEAQPVLHTLQQHDWKLTAILITHHHWDHTGGIEMIRKQYPVPVYGFCDEPINPLTKPLRDGETFSLPELKLTFQCLHIPGHTLGHCAFYGHGMVFSGDTLFTAGCGKIFEGTAQQMYDSLSKFIALPAETQLYCGHEYTTSNLKFASLVEPDNLAIIHRIAETQALRQQHLPSVPSLIGLELETNPFLRCEVDKVVAAAQHYAGKPLTDAVEVLHVLREWKNSL